MDEHLVARCQCCNVLTSRKCSACGVCIYCSPECEAKAALLSFADVACKLHRDWAREKTNPSTAGVHIMMLPSVRTSPSALSAAHLRWTALHQAAVHYLHVLLACTPSRIFSKTAFGMSIALTPESRFSCGCRRLVFFHDKTSQAATTMLGSMAALALAQMGAEVVGPPRLRDEDNAKDLRQVILLSGFVAKAKDGPSCRDPRWVVHFDAIYLTHTNNTWTVKRVQPLWEQELLAVGDKWYDMHYKPRGCVPSNARHPLALVEQALNPPPADPLPDRPQSPTPGEPPQARAQAAAPAATPEGPPLASAVAMKATLSREAAAAARVPRSAPQPASQAPPQWETYRAQVQAQVQAQETPPPWMGQLEAALTLAAASPLQDPVA